MANPNIPNGFDAIGRLDGGAAVAIKGYLNTTQTIACGDALILSSGRISIAASTSGSLAGVQAPMSGVTRLGSNIHTTPAADTATWFYDAHHYFCGQCSGTYAETMRGLICDIEGTTGIMEINENGTSKTVVCIDEPILGCYGGRTGLEVGANSYVKFHINRPMFGGMAADQTS